MKDGITLDTIKSVYPDFKYLLEVLGGTHVKDCGSYVKCCSMFHEEKNPSFILYKDSGLWKDFSGPFSGGDIEALVWHTKAMRLADFLGISKDEIVSDLYKKKEENRKYVNLDEYNPDDYDLIVEGSDIQPLKDSPRHWAHATRVRGMSKEFIEFFKVGYMNNSKVYLQKKNEYSDKIKKVTFFDRLCIPIYENHKRVSIEGRRIDGVKEYKVIYPSSLGGVGGSAYRRLFNIDNLDFDRPLIVCEGTMDMVKVWSYFDKNVTCTYGASLKPQHKKDLEKFKDIIVFSDSDEGGEHMIDHIYNFITDREIKVARLPDGLDPGDASLDQIEYALSHTIEGTEYLIKKNRI